MFDEFLCSAFKIGPLSCEADCVFNLLHNSTNLRKNKKQIKTTSGYDTVGIVSGRVNNYLMNNVYNKEKLNH